MATPANPIAGIVGGVLSLIPSAADPITGGLNLLTGLLNFGMMVYNDTPVPIRQQAAGDWGTFLHGINTEILKLQAKINGGS